MVTLALGKPDEVAVTVMDPAVYDLMVIFAMPYRMHLVSGHLELSKVIEEPVGNSPPPEVTERVIGAVLSIAVPPALTI
jgi:hypothetical protein